MIVLTKDSDLPLPPEGQHIAHVSRVSNLFNTKYGNKAVTVTYNVLDEKTRYMPLRVTYVLTQTRKNVRKLISFFEATGLSFEEGKAYTEEEIADMMRTMQGAIVRVEVFKGENNGKTFTYIANVFEATDEEVAKGQAIVNSRPDLQSGANTETVEADTDAPPF